MVGTIDGAVRNVAGIDATVWQDAADVLAVVVVSCSRQL